MVQAPDGPAVQRQQRHADHRQPPDDAEQGPPPGTAQGDQAERRITAGNQQVDRQVIDLLHDHLRPSAHTVIDRRHAIQGQQRDAVGAQLAHQVFQAMLVGIGPAQPRRDFGAIDRLRHHPERLVQHAEIEPREVKDFQNIFVGEQPLQIGRIGSMRWNLHHIGGAVAGR